MLRYAVPVLAAAGSAMAASSSCSVSATTTLQNAGDASAIATCTTFSGSIAIATNAVGAFDFSPSLERITGDFFAEGAPNLTSLASTSLTEIDGDWTLNNIQTLSSLSFPQLTSVGSIDWEGLPNLVGLSFNSEISQTTSFNLQNTALQSLDGLNFKKATGFQLANNNFLQAFSMQLQNVTGSILLQSNGNRMNVTFPNLETAQNITIDNVPSIDMPSLYSVEGVLAFNMNEGLESLSFPNLTTIGYGLSIIDNQDLTSISMPELKAIEHGAIKIQNNSALGNITFPSLTEVAGAFDAYGNFSSVSMPKITDIHGTFNVQSTKDLTDSCKVFDAEHGPNSAIKGGNYECNGTLASPSAASGDGSSGSGSGSSSGGNTGAAPSIRVTAFEITGIVGAVAAIAAFL